MENQYDSKQDTSAELEKLCMRGNLYAKRIDISKSKPFVGKMTNSPLRKIFDFLSANNQRSALNYPQKNKKITPKILETLIIKNKNN